MKLEQITIAHFTYLDNLVSIADHGLLCDSGTHKINHRCCGNAEIKQRRLEKDVPFGGTVGSYVPFYFAPRSPMLYTLHVNRKIVQSEIIYLVAKVSRIIEAGYNWCCTDMNAAKKRARFFDSPVDIVKNISWEYMVSQNWFNSEEHPERRERRMAEFLIRDRVKLVDFHGVAVYDANAKEKTEQFLDHRGFSLPVSIQPEWYFK